MHRHIVQLTSAFGEEDMEMTLLEACLAKNQLSRRHGFSPIQHVFGQDIRLPASILNGSGETAAQSLAPHKDHVNIDLHYDKQPGWPGYDWTIAAV
jgi:hypothetical protein